MILTVNQLCELCEEMKSKGNGNKKVYISSDDEGNYFHPLLYAFSYSEEDLKNYKEMGCIDETENIVLLG